MASRTVSLVASLALSLFFTTIAALGDTCVDYDEPYELLGGFETGTGVTAIALDAPMSLLHVTYTFNCCGGGTTGSRTVAIDVSDPAQIVPLDSYERPGSSPPEPLAHVTADGGVVCGFVTGGPEDELHVGDATDPSDIGFVTTAIAGVSGTSAAVVRDGLLYAANGGVLVVFDVSDPSAPSEIGRVAAGLAAAEMVAGNGVVYVVGGSTLWTADVSDPANPEVDGTIGLPHAVEHVTHEGDRAYVFGEDILTVIDVSDPSAPVVRGSVGVDGGEDIAVQGEHVLVARIGLLVFVDVSDPDAPAESGAVLGPTDSFYGFGPHYARIVASGPTVYTGYTYAFPSGPETYEGGGHVYSQLSPPDDAIVATVSTPTSLTELVVEGTQGTGMGPNGELYVFDLSTPEAPALIGNVVTDAQFSRHARRGDLAAVASINDGLAIVDLSDPAVPIVVGTDATEAADAIAMHPGIAYVTAEYDLRVVDLSVPSAPTTLARVEGLWDTSPYGGRVVVSTGDLLLLGTYHHLHVIDVSVPASPQVIGSVDIENGVSGIVVHGQFAFAAGLFDIRTIDLADPSNPLIVATVSTRVGPSMTIIGTTLYADAGLGFRVFDIADPIAPSLTGRYTASTPIAYGLADRGGHLFAAGENGLTVFRPQCGIVGVDDADAYVSSGLQARGKLSVHPSPLRSTAFVRFESEGSGSTRLVGRVIDVQGRVVDEVVLHRQESGYAGTWEADGHTSGVYFVTVETPLGSHSRRIVLLD